MIEQLRHATYVVATVDEEFAQMATHKASTTRHKHAIALHAWLCFDRNIRKVGQRVGACEHYEVQAFSMDRWCI